jgi:signal transduction histidine kinase
MEARASTAAAAKGRGRERAVLVAGLGGALALGWAGVVLHDNARLAGEVALERIAGQVADSVEAEWERLLRQEEPPVAPAGLAFEWTADEPPLEPFERNELPAPGASHAVSDTLLAEAERLEIAEQDPAAALELVREALAATASGEEAARRPLALLRAIQLGSALGRTEDVRTDWDDLRGAVDLKATLDGLPVLALAWLKLPEPLRAGSSAAELFGSASERLFADRDRLTFDARGACVLEAAPELVLLCERLGLAAPPLERRAAAALARLAGELPAPEPEGRWRTLEIGGRPFLARRRGDAVTGFFHAHGVLEAALAERCRLPERFRLALGEQPDVPGVALRPRASLAGSNLTFELRHDDPQRIVREETARLALLRGGLFALALAAAAGGFLVARVLARERKLAELKTAFVTGVSHDLRTPLASILLLAENLEQKRVGRDQEARYHRAIRREAERLRRLVDNVLDFSRLERGDATELRREALELPRFLDDLAGECRERVEESGRPFAAAPGPVPESAALDGPAVRRAVHNLVDNALKHGAGEVRLDWEAANGKLWLSVSDEGNGVPPPEREVIFRPFRRGSSAVHANGGTGLGLAIVRGIAHAHGGEVTLASAAKARGTTFVLELPLERDEDES